jgi:chemotaxis protein CheC
LASILIIDDSAFMRNKISEAVKTDNHVVQEAPDGLIGLQMAFAQKPDCIILDLNMPELDGIGILRTLHDRGICIPVIVVTADIQVSVQKQCLALGAAALINKPPQEKELLRTVREVLSTQRKGPAVRQATPRQLDALKDVINKGVGRAAEALNQMVNLTVSLEVPFIRIMSPLEFKQDMGALGDKTMAAVRMGFYGAFSGSVAFVMLPESASKLVSAVTGGTPRSGPRAVMEETLREIGNIAVNGVLGSLGNILKEQISYSVPAYAELSIKHLFFSEKIGNDTVFLLVRTRFAIHEIDVEGNIILLFTVGAFDSLLDAIDGRSRNE